MKFILGFALTLSLIIAVVFAQGTQHCISKAFTAVGVLLDPTKGTDDLERIWFDATTNKQRVDIDVLEPAIKRLSIYLRHDLGKGYEYDRTTGKCVSFPVEGQLQPFCLAHDAQLNGTVVIGGTLKCSVWKEQVRGFNIRLVLAPNTVPVNIISRGGHLDTVFQEFVNWEGSNTLADQSVFNVPTVCTRASAERNVEVKSEKVTEMQERYAWLNPNF
ncbi:hypothetical protein ABK040_013472 [Willaertia magna]